MDWYQVAQILATPAAILASVLLARRGWRAAYEQGVLMQHKAAQLAVTNELRQELAAHLNNYATCARR